MNTFKTIQIAQRDFDKLMNILTEERVPDKLLFEEAQNELLNKVSDILYAFQAEYNELTSSASEESKLSKVARKLEQKLK